LVLHELLHRGRTVSALVEIVQVLAELIGGAVERIVRLGRVEAVEHQYHYRPGLIGLVALEVDFGDLGPRLWPGHRLGDRGGLLAAAERRKDEAGKACQRQAAAYFGHTIQRRLLTS